MLSKIPVGSKKNYFKYFGGHGLFASIKALKMIKYHVKELFLIGRIENEPFFYVNEMSSL